MCRPFIANHCTFDSVIATTCNMLRNPKHLYGPNENNIPANLNLGDFLVKGLKQHGDKVALVCTIYLSNNILFFF